VIIVCVGNAGRSQIAEALLRRFGGADFEVESAGTDPSPVSPYALRVLEETGIDWSRAVSKSVTAFAGQSFDYVITLCDEARQSCPVFPGSSQALRWGLRDPGDVHGTDQQKLQAYRRTHRQLALRLRQFVVIARRNAGNRAASVSPAAIAQIPSEVPWTSRVEPIALESQVRPASLVSPASLDA
jgi:arsenate reductase